MLPKYARNDVTYPRKADLLATQSPVKNQNRRGVCTIFTTTGLMEHLYLVSGAQNPSFSEQYLQWSVKAQLGSLQNYEGSNIPDNVQAVATYGIVDEATYPYVGTEWTAANDPACAPNGSESQTLPMQCWTQGDPPAAVQAATKYTLPQGRYLNTADIKMHINDTHTAVAVAIDFFYQAWAYPHTLPVNHADSQKGLVRYPNATDVTESHKDRAGHGILIVGWDDDFAVPQIDDKGNTVTDANGQPVLEKGFYIFKNSWGTDRWGSQSTVAPGYGLIAQRYIDDFGSAYVTDAPAL
jgi:C1A family cysteine protease